MLWSLFVLGTLSCGTDPVPLSPSTSSKQEFSGALIQETPALILLSVDDTDTAEAAALRDRVLPSLRAGLMERIEGRWTGCGNPDPAAWHPGDIRIALVRPSAPDGESLLTPIQRPGLSWVTQSSVEAEVDGVMAEVGQALGERLAMAGEMYRPLHGVQRVLDLVEGKRAPADQAESDFLASLPKDLMVSVLIAGLGDDQGGVDEPGYKAGSTLSFLPSRVMVGVSNDPLTCEPMGVGKSRVEQWGALMGFTAHGLPCDEVGVWDNLFKWGVADCGVSCEAKKIEVTAEGVASCRMYIDLPGVEGCDGGHGWRDPEGKVVMVEHGGEMYRRCEIGQLSGSALLACRDTLACDGCGSGFCVTEVPELVPVAACPAGTSPLGLRFVGGALAGEGGFLYGECLMR